jgi:lipopolysaccharide biosynthesis regulator YciM
MDPSASALLCRFSAQFSDKSARNRGPIACVPANHARHTRCFASLSRHALGGILEQRGGYDQAIPVLDHAVRLQSDAGVDRAEQAATLLELANTQRYNEAETETFAGYVIVSKHTAPTVSWLKSAREDLVSIYDARHEWKKAEGMRAEATHVAQAASNVPIK